MVAQAKCPYITPEEYLRREKEAETKSEYIDGVIVAMAGGSKEHDAIAFTLVGETYPHLKSAGAVDTHQICVFECMPRIATTIRTMQ